MHDSPPVNSAVEAVRCFYLAHLVEQKGYGDAAERWRRMANTWLDRLEPNTGRSGPSPVEASWQSPHP